MERLTLVDAIVGRFQGHKDWSSRYVQKLRGLSAARLEIAQRATSLDELDLLFADAPFASGTRMTAIMNDRPGNVSIMAEKPVAKSTPGTSPTSYDDLVFTAVAPCRIYDSRFTTAPADGAAGAPWPVGVTRTIRVGPYADYSTQGGQATPCLGAVGGLAGAGEVAAILGSVSTVSQTGQGYLTMFSAGAASPNPYGVVQYYQPGYVQTSFLVMTTDLIDPVWSQGASYQASTHVIVDVVGYFARPKAVALNCTTVNGSGTAAASTDSLIGYPACASGFTRTGGYCFGPAFNNNGYLIESGASFCTYRNLSATPYGITAVSQCCQTAGRP